MYDLSEVYLICVITPESRKLEGTDQLHLNEHRSVDGFLYSRTNLS